MSPSGPAQGASPGADPVPARLAARLEALAANPRPLPLRRTERLLLRPWQESDRDDFASLNADPRVFEHLLGPLDRAASDALLDRLRLHAARRSFGVWAAADRESRAFVGMVGLAVVGWEASFTPAVEILWRLVPERQGQGLATEAAREALRFAFGELALPRVVSFTVPANERSWRLMERLGMRRRGGFDHPLVPEGHPLRAHLLYELDAPSSTSAPPPSPPSGAAAGGAPGVPGPASPPGTAAAPGAPTSLPAGPAPAAPLPHLWIDGDGCPRPAKELAFRLAERGAATITLVANRPVMVPRSPRVHSVVVPRGLDVADDWLVAHAGPGDLVITSDIPLAAELVARGVAVLSPRGEAFTPENIGEKLSIRDWYTEARASGMIEGGGPPPFDERARRAFAHGLDRWLASTRTPRR